MMCLAASASKDAYSSCHRWYLDTYLAATPWHGRILDIGGKKENKRGVFRPPLGDVECWEYVNIDAATQPDWLAQADAIPVPSNSYDIVLMSEVLEHLAEPEDALREAWRVLRPNGILVNAAPFLIPLHADPDDYQRWLPAKYKRVLARIGFEAISVTPMGGFFAVCHDLVQTVARYWFRQRQTGLKSACLGKAVPWALRRLFLLENRHPSFCRHFATTGYYVHAVKSDGGIPHTTKI